MEAGILIREARQRAGLTQVELAKKLGTTQSVVSAYESSDRQPSLPTLLKLVEATGQRLDVRVRTPGEAPLLTRLVRHREEISRIAARHGFTNVRVFGSVARGEETAASDIDLLVDVGPGVGLVAFGRCAIELEELLGVKKVDLVPSEGLKPLVAPSILRDALQL